MSAIDLNVAGWHLAFKRPSTGDRYMITVGLPDRDAALAVAVNAAPHIFGDVLIGETPVTATLLARYGLPHGSWQQTV